jgi:Myotubularin-like phosphatase domain
MRSLIHKDWVYYGHNFMKSCNLNNDVPSLAEQNYAPLFVLFLDCVFQLVRQNELSFEFTEGYLVYLAYHCFTSKYFELTHLNPLYYLNASQPAKGGSAGSPASEELASIFSSFDPSHYANKFYHPLAVRKLTYHPSDICLWRSYFGRYTPDLKVLEGAHQYERTAAFHATREENKVKAKLLYSNYMAILEARENSPQCALTKDELSVVMEIE